jgi:DNA-binding NarL/FixJ family response regulator
MKVLCVGRHPYLSEHLVRFFESAGMECIPCVGLDGASALVAEHRPDAVICDYDLLAIVSLEEWETDAVLSQIPVIAVSLTRHPGEAHLLDVNNIAGFLYLPTLDPEDAHRVLAAVQRRESGINPPAALHWPVSTQAARSH